MKHLILRGMIFYIKYRSYKDMVMAHGCHASPHAGLLLGSILALLWPLRFFWLYERSSKGLRLASRDRIPKVESSSVSKSKIESQMSGLTNENLGAR